MPTKPSFKIKIKGGTSDLYLGRDPNQPNLVLTNVASEVVCFCGTAEGAYQSSEWYTADSEYLHYERRASGDRVLVLAGSSSIKWRLGTADRLRCSPENTGEDEYYALADGTQLTVEDTSTSTTWEAHDCTGLEEPIG